VGSSRSWTWTSPMTGTTRRRWKTRRSTVSRTGSVTCWEPTPPRNDRRCAPTSERPPPPHVSAGEGAFRGECIRGAGGNRTRVRSRGARTSPGAVRNGVFSVPTLVRTRRRRTQSLCDVHPSPITRFGSSGIFDDGYIRGRCEPWISVLYLFAISEYAVTLLILVYNIYND